MKKLISVFILLCFFQIGFSQVIEIEDEEITEAPHEPVIIDASYKGGVNNFYNYIGTNFNFNNLKKSDVIAPYKGRDIMMIYIQFSINEEGKPVDFKAMNTTNENTFYTEAVRVIESTRWKPATEDGVFIKQEFRIPIQAYIRDFQE